MEHIEEPVSCPGCGEPMRAGALYWTAKDAHARCVCSCGWHAPAVDAGSRKEALKRAKEVARLRVDTPTDFELMRAGVAARHWPDIRNVMAREAEKEP